METASMIEKTDPKIFHIHIDAQSISTEFYTYAKDRFDFVDTDFDGHPDGYDHFEPKKHLTLKLYSKKDFENIWRKLVETADQHEFIGYLEGEYIPTDEYIPYKPFDKEVEFPFSIKTRPLDPSKNESFRQTEIHLTLDKNKSDPQLIKQLLDSGLYGAFIPKKDGVFLVLTMQGYLGDIHLIQQLLTDYLNNAGGAYRCTLKEERAIRHKRYGISVADLPVIADQVLVNPK